MRIVTSMKMIIRSMPNMLIMFCSKNTQRVESIKNHYFSRVISARFVPMSFRTQFVHFLHKLVISSSFSSLRTHSRHFVISFVDSYQVSSFCTHFSSLRTQFRHCVPNFVISWSCFAISYSFSSLRTQFRHCVLIFVIAYSVSSLRTDFRHCELSFVIYSFIHSLCRHLSFLPIFCFFVPIYHFATILVILYPCLFLPISK